MKRRNFLGAIPIAAASAGLLLKGCETNNSTAPSGVENTSSAVDLMTAAAEFEASTIKTYEFALNSGLLVDPSLQEIANRNLGHHNEHLGAFNGWLVNNNAPEVSRADASPVSGTEVLASETEISQFAMELEFSAANFYFSQIQAVDGVARRLFSDVFPVEFAHTMEFKRFLNLNPDVNSGLFQSVTLGGS